MNCLAYIHVNYRRDNDICESDNLLIIKTSIGGKVNCVA